MIKALWSTVAAFLMAGLIIGLCLIVAALHETNPVAAFSVLLGFIFVVTFSMFYAIEKAYTRW